jgi:hypothetical protein
LDFRFENIPSGNPAAEPRKISIGRLSSARKSFVFADLDLPVKTDWLFAVTLDPDENGKKTKKKRISLDL